LLGIHASFISGFTAMLLLKECQVQPCTVVRQNIFEEVVLPGVSFQGKLFFCIAQYAPEQSSHASKEALARFSQHQEQFSILIVEARDRLTLWQEDPELKPCSARKAKVRRIQQMDLKKIAQRIHGPGGVEIRDRRVGLRRQKYCFVAKEISQWLSKTYNLTENDGLRLAQRMVDDKIIYSLKLKENFEANGDFYRFYDDEL
jgi:hypothetical protein